MIEEYVERVHTDIVLDLDDDIGALIIYTKENLLAHQINVSLRGGGAAERFHTEVLERSVDGCPVFAATFASLPEGEYITWSDPPNTFTIVGGRITELNWCNSNISIAPVSSDDVEVLLGTSQRTAPSSPLSNLLPPRYREGKKVSSAPMGSAPMQYTENGQVAWNEIWTSFCDLALAGGPPHRSTLLEPASADEIKGNMAGYKRVLAEIARGLRLVTGLPILHTEQLGWIGLVCQDQEMAFWLSRAITVENVSVRREGAVLYLPVGPNFHIEKEIKNVIPVVAKTNHYWMEHITS